MLQENRFQLSKLRSRESCDPVIFSVLFDANLSWVQKLPCFGCFLRKDCVTLCSMSSYVFTLTTLSFPFLKAGKLATWACGKGDGCPLDAFEEVCIWDNPRGCSICDENHDLEFRSQKESENCENGELGCIFQAFQALACLGNPCKDLWCFCADRPSKAQGCKLCDRCWAVVEVVLNVSKVIKSQELQKRFNLRQNPHPDSQDMSSAQDTINLVSTSIQTIELEDSRVRDLITWALWTHITRTRPQNKCMQRFFIYMFFAFSTSFIHYIHWLVGNRCAVGHDFNLFHCRLQPCRSIWRFRRTLMLGTDQKKSFGASEKGRGFVEKW